MQLLQEALQEGGSCPTQTRGQFIQQAMRRVECRGQTTDSSGEASNQPQTSVTAQASWGIDVCFCFVLILGCMQSLSVSAQACPEREPMLPGKAANYSQPCMSLSLCQFVVPA